MTSRPNPSATLALSEEGIEVGILTVYKDGPVQKYRFEEIVPVEKYLDGLDEPLEIISVPDELPKEATTGLLEVLSHHHRVVQRLKELEKRDEPCCGGEDYTVLPGDIVYVHDSSEEEGNSSDEADRPEEDGDVFKVIFGLDIKRS